MNANEQAVKARRKLRMFLALTVVLVGLSYIPVIRAGTLEALGGWAVYLVMWAPGVAAMLTQVITERRLAGMGWRVRTWPLLLLALGLPALYGAVVYLPVWASGLAGFDPGGWSQAAPGNAPLQALGLLLTVGILISLGSALGEEIGWRGLLVPELAKLGSFRFVAVVSGLIWTLYHVPLIIFADYHGIGTPLWFSLACFFPMVMAIAVVMAWLRLKSGSLWPPALLHASHNLIIQGVFDTATRHGPWSGYLTGEFGIGLVMAIGATAWVLCKRGGVPVTETMGPPKIVEATN
jgi:membrane protease YdiL (CAAX protease family)